MRLILIAVNCPFTATMMLYVVVGQCHAIYHSHFASASALNVL